MWESLNGGQQPLAVLHARGVCPSLVCLCLCSILLQTYPRLDAWLAQKIQAFPLPSSSLALQLGLIIVIRQIMSWHVLTILRPYFIQRQAYGVGILTTFCQTVGGTERSYHWERGNLTLAPSPALSP